MLARLSRSTSRTFEAAPSNSSSMLLRYNSQDSPTTGSSLPSPALPHSKIPHNNQEMISTITRQSSTTPHEVAAQSSIGVELAQSDDLQEDDRSSSLSDPVDDTDDLPEEASMEQNQAAEFDVDSETETERLERTPQKLNTTSGRSLLPEKSPSKLAQVILADSSAADIDAANSLLADLSQSKSAPIDESGAFGRDSESPSRKRKRPLSVVSSLSDTDEPLAKRSQSARYQTGAATSIEKLNHTTDVGREDAGTEQDVEAGIVAEEDAEVESVEPVAPVRGRKGGRKGKRKGRKAALEADPEQLTEHVEDIHEEEKDTADAFAEEEEEGSRDEEVAKKKLAHDALTKIEKEFSVFREKHINQQLGIITQELEFLNQPSCTHPEYQAQLRCLDEYRDKKIRYEDTVLKFKMQANRVRTVAERQQHHSQYFQEVRDLRDKALEDCYQNLYALQKDRRRWGADETNYAHLYNPKRPQQIAQQSSYNLEVSILSGVAKHVGFPAAPELPTLLVDDVESDLRLMKIPERPLQPRILLRDAERAADPSFFEQNAWANPPVTQAMASSQTFATPNALNRIVSNGSTVDAGMMSAPNSQHVTPQNGHFYDAGGEMSKPSPLGLAKLASTAEAVSSGGTMSSVLGATGVPNQVFPTSGLHGTPNKNGSPAAAAPLAAMSIAVGGNGRFPP